MQEFGAAYKAGPPTQLSEAMIKNISRYLKTTVMLTFLKHQHHYHHLKHHQWLQIELLTEITNKSLAMMMTAPLGSRRADTESSW